MWPRQRAVAAVSVGVAALGILIASQQLRGLAFAGASAAVMLAVLGLNWASFSSTNRAWVAESYRLMGDGLLTQALARVEAELSRPGSPLARGLLQVIRAEALLWTGDFEAALTQARAIEVAKLPTAWHRPVWGTQVAALAFLDRVSEAEALAQQHHAVLTEAPGFHQLQAVLALGKGEAARAHELMSLKPEDPARPRLLRAARCLISGEIELALGRQTPAVQALTEAAALGGQSFVTERARLRLRG